MHNPKIDMQEMWEEFRALKAKAITYSHYELAEKTAINDSDLWKEFLNTAEVSKWVESERQLLNTAEITKLMYNAANSRSTGQAQILNALVKLQEDNGQKDLPIFIYCYIPPDANEVHAPMCAPIERGDNTGA